MTHQKSQIHLKFRPKTECINGNIMIFSKVSYSSMEAAYHNISDCLMFLGSDDLSVGLIF